MAKFQMNVTLNELADYATARVADDSVGAQPLLDADVGKFLKLNFTSQYGLCAVGNEIEGVMASGPDSATMDGFKIATVRKNGRALVTLDGLQATPGTGVIALGDYVVAGTVAARGTSLADAPPKVCKATAAGAGLIFTWRVVALYGTTAVGQTALIERV
jgi:hypothetical protein